MARPFSYRAKADSGKALTRKLGERARASLAAGAGSGTGNPSGAAAAACACTSSVAEAATSSDGANGGREMIWMDCHPERETALRCGRRWRAETCRAATCWRGGGACSTIGGRSFTAGSISREALGSAVARERARRHRARDTTPCTRRRLPARARRVRTRRSAVDDAGHDRCVGTGPGRRTPWQVTIVRDTIADGSLFTAALRARANSTTLSKRSCGRLARARSRTVWMGVVSQETNCDSGGWG